MTIIWVLTSEYNDYDQHGAYFEGVFLNKPNVHQLAQKGVPEHQIDRLLNKNGGRVGSEYHWYNLEEVLL